MNLWLIITVKLTAQVVCITAMINRKFMSFSAVQVYDLSYIFIYILQFVRVYYELTM